jgi:hypothetical protein
MCMKPKGIHAYTQKSQKDLCVHKATKDLARPKPGPGPGVALGRFQALSVPGPRPSGPGLGQVLAGFMHMCINTIRVFMHMCTNPIVFLCTCAFSAVWIQAASESTIVISRVIRYYSFSNIHLKPLNELQSS